MEAPEKIYLTQLMLFAAPTISNSDNDVEYTRTDAFIEKACEWLKTNVTYINPRKGTEECVVNLTRFKDYMNGE